MRTWKTKEGVEIPVGDMTTDHIKNVIAMLERSALLELAKMPYPNPQGEMAQYELEGAYRYLTNCTTEELASEMYEIYDDLVAELQRREPRKTG